MFVTSLSCENQESVKKETFYERRKTGCFSLVRVHIPANPFFKGEGGGGEFVQLVFQRKSLHFSEDSNSESLNLEIHFTGEDCILKRNFRCK